MKKIIFAALVSLFSVSSFANSYICYSLEGSRHVPLFVFVIGSEEVSTDADGNALNIRPVRVIETKRDQELNVASVGKASLAGINLTLLQEGDIIVGEINARPSSYIAGTLEGTIKLQGLAGDKVRPIGCQQGK